MTRKKTKSHNKRQAPLSVSNQDTHHEQVGFPSSPVPSQPAREENAQHIEASLHFQGPLPPPTLLSEYDNIIPGGAERILAMAESEVGRRHEREKDTLNAVVEDSRAQRIETRIGQILGFLTAMALLVFSGLVICMVPTATGVIMGSALGGGTLVALVYAFRYSQRPQIETPEKGKE